MNRRTVTWLIGGLFVLLLAASATGALVASFITGQVDTPATGGACGTTQHQPVGPTPATAVGAARAAIAAGWSAADATTAVAIAGAESGYRPTARNSIGASGLWQVLQSAHPQLFHGRTWTSPVVNARMAHSVWQAAGRSWSPWTTYTSGAYRSHLAEARTAVNDVLFDTSRIEPIQHVSSRLQPAAQQAEAFIRTHWGFTGTIGGYAHRNIAGTDTLSKHALGLAIDVMLPVGRESNAIAAYFAGPGYRTFGVDNVIHNRRIYNKARGWHAYTGINPHTNHVHIDFVADGAATDAATVNLSDSLCVQAAATGPIVYPLPANSHYRDLHNYGGNGPRWAHGHTGTDLSVACGTPVLAATAGTIVIVDGPSWFGTWLVKVSTGAGKLTTWYAHMQALDVSNGDTVKAGQQIGQVGARGNATGCHLHFEVHPHGGGIYQDGVDPSAWLASHVGRDLNAGFVEAANVSGRTGFTISTFNVLGSSHTRRGGEEAWRPSGPARMHGVVTLLDRYGVDVVGFQEFQPDQRTAFLNMAGDRYALWHPGRDTVNSIAWRRSAFTLVGTSTLSIPYFDGHPRRMPIVELRDRGTGQVAFFLNAHNPAETHRFHHQGGFRRTATHREARTVDALRARFHAPVFVTGDMNDHSAFYCPFVARTSMHAAAGGHGCHPPRTRRANIDWILASPDVRFSGYQVLDGPLVDRTTDHPFTHVQAQTR